MKRVPYAKEQSLKTQNNDHTTAAYQPNIFRAKNLAVDLKKMPMGIIYHEFLLIATCEKTNFVHAIPMQNRQTETIANALLHRVCCLTGPPTNYQ